MLKPLFGFDVTEDKKNNKSYSDLFLIRKVDAAIEKEHDEKVETVVETENKSKLSPYLLIIEYLALMFGILVVTSFLRVEGGVTQAIRNAPILSLSGIFSLIVGVVLWLVGREKKKRVLEKENAEEKIENLKISTEKVFEYLGVPSVYTEADILLFKFSFKGEKMKLHTPTFASTPFYNHPFRLYIEDYKLCIADTGAVYAFPIAEFKEIRMIKKVANLPGWNKDIPYNKGEYKQFKLSTNSAGVCSKPYYVLVLEHEGEEYGIYFPKYELPTFQSLTGITVVCDKDKEEESV